MEMKQCPQCGKYVSADRTYCMNCGVTLGIRCPACRGVAPVGAKTCPDCGHSFVKKKKKLHFPLWKWMKTNAKPLIGAALLLCAVLVLVAAAFPAVQLSVLAGEEAILEHRITGYTLIRSFLGTTPGEVADLLELKDLKEVAQTIRVFLLVEGAGWLLILAGLAVGILLLIPNYKRLGALTAKRLYAPLGIALGGAALAFAFTPAVSAMLAGAMGRYTEDPEAGFLVDTTVTFPLYTLIGVAVLFALATSLHIGVFRKLTPAQQEREELSVSQILSVPLGYLGRLIRRIAGIIRKKTGKRRPSRDDEPTFAATPRFTSYLILLGISLVFTQALLSKISHIFFWFLFLLPLVLIVYTLIAKSTISVDMLSESATTEKNTPYTYEFRIHNRSILALPFIEAQVSIPQSNSVRCTERTVRLSMAPLTSYHMKNTVSFRFRGTYDIGVKCFYIYDFFRLFRARVDVENITTVYVLPRRLTLDDTLAQAVSDSTTRTVRSPLVVDKLEVSDIRDYQNGDSLKSIHWKLSSKSENFIVKDYNTGTSNQTVVFCDLTPHFPDEPPKEKPAEGMPLTKKDKKSMTPAERKAAKKAEKAEKAERKANKKSRREKERAEADKRAKAKRVRENKNTAAISDEALNQRLIQRAAAAELLSGKDGAEEAAPLETVEIFMPDVHELARPAHYDDMNEYLADGVVELTVAMVLAELRQGHEVLLLWFDRRSDTGVFAYPLHGADEFENIYHLFATAPLCAPDLKVTSLTAMVSDIQSAKQLFAISTLDTVMLTDLSALPGISDAGSFGSAEVVLYNPEERFKYPRERRAYLEGCREQLAANGLSLTAGSFNIVPPVTDEPIIVTPVDPTTAKEAVSHEA